MSDEKSPASAGADPQAQPASADPQNVVILPPEAVREAAAKGTGLRVTITTAHSGPLPSPATLREYEQVVPGLPATIVQEFKNEAAHRRLMQKIGSIGAISIALMAIVAGTVLGFVLHSPLAAFAVIGPVCGVVGTAQLLEFWFKSR